MFEKMNNSVEFYQNRFMFLMGVKMISRYKELPCLLFQADWERQEILLFECNLSCTNPGLSYHLNTNDTKTGWE